MPSGLRAPTSRAAAFSVLTVSLLLPLAGCPEEDTGNDTPTLILSSSAGTSLEADGNRTLTLQVRAFNAEQQPDNAAVTVSVDTGTLATASGSVDDSGRSATLTPQEGKAEFTFQCPFREPGAVRIAASNGSAEATFSVNCIEPRGTYVIRADPSDCSDGSPITASGEDSCRIGVTVELRGATESFPEEGVPVTARVLSATADDPNQTADTRVLAAAATDRDSVADSVVVVTGDEGEASLFLFSTQLAVPQRVEIELTAEAPDTTVLSQVVTVAIGQFNNQSEVFLSPLTVSVATGQTYDLTVRAQNQHAQPAEGATVTVSVLESSGASLRAGDAEAAPSVEVTLGADGTAPVTFVSPPVDEPRDVVVTATYAPESLPVENATSTIKVFPEDALLVNTVAAPANFRSDEDGSATITVTVSRYTNGQQVNVDNAPVTFTVQTSDVERLMFDGDGPPPILGLERATNADGVASAVVRAQNDRIRGRTRVEVAVVDPDDATQVIRQTVEIQVERDPILQSLVFQSAEPAQIGVTGSAYPSSSVVTFQVLDDLGQPIPDVLVQFDVNAASDPSASVVSEGFTDAAGLVSTVLSAGTQAGPISVVATAAFDGRTLVAESLPVGVFGGLPSFGNSYVVIDRAEVIQNPPFTGAVTMVLADRFTNRAPDGLVVQFRAEGGNIDSIVTSGDGSSTASFVTGAPGGAAASLYSNSGDSWSHGALIPADGDLVSTAGFAAGDCFDGRSQTACNVYAMCNESSDVADPNYVYCPLPRDAAGEGCWEGLEAGVLTGDPADLSDALVASLPAGTDLNQVLNILQTNEGAVAYYSAVHVDHEVVRTLVDAYLSHNHDCGPKTACLVGDMGGLDYIAGDECPVAPGCMDFDVGTRCPQDGLLSVTASTRGEEAFVDLNGNGIFDFADADGNNRHDPGEDVLETPGISFEQVVVDMPEPYLDKNSNGTFDEYLGSPRLSTYDEYRLTDLFGDEDASGTFGYGQGATAFTNHQWDRDKQIFFSTNFLSVGRGEVRLGQRCTAAQIGGNADCTYGERASAPCREVNSSPTFGDADGITPGWEGITEGCAARADLPADGEFELVFQVVDGNGNCASPGFASTAEVTTEGPIKVTFAPTALEEGYCGFGVQRDGQRPWLETIPGLGARLLSIDVAADCEDADGPEIATIEVTAGDAAPESVSFLVECAGDGG